jgi:hypothetical protein
MATLSADYAAVKAWVVAAWAYVQAEYKQLVAAALVGHYTGIVETIVTWVHKVI